MRGGRKDAEVAFDLALGADGIEQTGDGVLPRRLESGEKKVVRVDSLCPFERHFGYIVSLGVESASLHSFALFF